MLHEQPTPLKHFRLLFHWVYYSADDFKVLVKIATKTTYKPAN